jgi:protein-disulfide isomerase
MLEKLACSLGRNDEEPNVELAKELAKTKNKKGIKEIVNGLNDPKEQIANDCIKVLYEIAGIAPELISEYAGNLVQLLRSRNNRLVWGSMTALSKIVSFNPDEIFQNLDIIVKAYENGSVITVDNSISVFAELAKADKKYEKKVFPIIIEHLEKCRPKEVGQHAERAFVCVNKNNSQIFRETLLKRQKSLTEAQKKRLDKLLGKL